MKLLVLLNEYHKFVNKGQHPTLKLILSKVDKKGKKDVYFFLIKMQVMSMGPLIKGSGWGEVVDVVFRLLNVYFV